MKIRANNIELEVQVSGELSDAQGQHKPVVLLVMGLGMQLTAWPPALVQALVEAGYWVVRFDNRDAGLSQRLDGLGTPNLLWESLKHAFKLRLQPPYSLHDMALDVIGLLDALQVARAHLVGVSMGGMIAQRVALAAPERTLSLSSIMSSSGARHLPGPLPHIARVLLARPSGLHEPALIAHGVKLFTLLSGPGFAVDAAALRQQVTAAVRRAHTPRGTARQLVAVLADDARCALLPRLQTPTLVVHGKADPLLPYACGVDTARRIPGAQLLGIEGLGHDLPPGVLTPLADALLAHFEAAQRAPSPAAGQVLATIGK